MTRCAVPVCCVAPKVRRNSEGVAPLVPGWGGGERVYTTYLARAHMYWQYVFCSFLQPVAILAQGAFPASHPPCSRWNGARIAGRCGWGLFGGHLGHLARKPYVLGGPKESPEEQRTEKLRRAEQSRQAAPPGPSKAWQRTGVKFMGVYRSQARLRGLASIPDEAQFTGGLGRPCTWTVTAPFHSIKNA